MKMSALVILVLVGLAVCAVILCRPALRTRAEAARPVTAWQQEREQPAPSFTATQRGLMLNKRLQREEEKQRPWEGRN